MKERRVSRPTEKDAVRELRHHWQTLRTDIERRLADFDRVRETADDGQLFAELTFCLFTPQSKATACWAAVCDLRDEGLLTGGGHREIAARLNRVRFRNNKSRYVVEARRLFSVNGRLAVRRILDSFSSPSEAREWLVANVKGMGYKEASHFLRNVGRGEDLAILDRHILKNLVLLGVIDSVPSTLTPRTYRDIEQRMLTFSRRTGIPPEHLDLLLWCRETGEIFK